MINKFFTKKLKKLPFILIIIIICSCSNSLTDDILNKIECPQDIGQRIVYYANVYTERNTKYEWGGQDLLENDGIIKIDCSGLVVNCLKYAIAGTNYSLLFNDSAVINFYNRLV